MGVDWSSARTGSVDQKCSRGVWRERITGFDKHRRMKVHGFMARAFGCTANGPPREGRIHPSRRSALIGQIGRYPAVLAVYFLARRRPFRMGLCATKSPSILMFLLTNKSEPWRNVYGPPPSDAKDRVFAMAGKGKGCAPILSGTSFLPRRVGVLLGMPRGAAVVGPCIVPRISDCRQVDMSTTSCPMFVLTKSEGYLKRLARCIPRHVISLHGRAHSRRRPPSLLQQKLQFCCSHPGRSDTLSAQIPFATGSSSSAGKSRRPRTPHGHLLAGQDGSFAAPEGRL